MLIVIGRPAEKAKGFRGQCRPRLGSGPDWFKGDTLRRDFAINRNGVKDIFLNTPTQAGWFERYLFDWAGPAARLGKMRFAMKASIFPDATMQFSGKVDAVTPSHCGRWVWVDVQLAIHLDGGELASTCEARLAVPQGPEVNLWSVPAAEWQP